MRSRLLFAAIAAAVLALVAQAAADGPETVPPSSRPAALRAVVEDIRAQNTSGPKLDSRLGTVATTAREDGRASAMTDARSLGLAVKGDAVRVVVEGDASVPEIQALGGRVEADVEGLTQALVPPGSLARLASLGSVEAVRPPATPRTLSVTSEGVALSGGDRLQAAGNSGAGTTVAVIDLGFAGYAQRISDGDLPAGVVTQDFCGGGLTTATVHGTGVAEIVHDTAPGATLLLLCINSEVTLQQAVSYAIANGASVIVHSVGWYGTSGGDGSGAAGSPDAIAAQARTAGVIWVNAAGNDGETHRSFGWQDANQDFFDDWEFRFAQSAGRTACVQLKWDGWPQTTDDYDLLLVSWPAGQLLAASTNDQSDGPSTPVEEACWTNTSGSTQNVEALVARYSASGGLSFDLFLSGGVLEGPGTGSSVVEPASSGAVVAVGATCAASPRQVPEPYSSSSGLIDSRVKPDVLAVDSVTTQSYGSPTTCATGFAGTSAAAPLVGGMAALIRQAVPTLTVDQVENRLLGDTVPSGSGVAGRVAARASEARGDIAFAWWLSPEGRRILVTTPGGGASTDLGVALPSGGMISDVAWSPDGSKIAFVRSDGTNRIWIAHADGTAPDDLVEGIDPSWTPDGNSIVYATSVDGDYDIHRIDVDHGGHVVLTANSTDERDPDVAPDGRIAYSGTVPPAVGPALFVMNADGTGVTQLKAPVGGVPGSTNPDWSPDGARIAYVESPDVFGGVRTMASGGGSIQDVVANADAPSWSPDGTKLAVQVAVPIDPSTSVWRIATVNANGTGLAVLARLGDAISAISPSWRPGPARAPEEIRGPRIEGLAMVGSPLRVRPGEWLGQPVRHTVQWESCNDLHATSCAPIPGATGVVYIPRPADVGRYFRVEVRTTNTTGVTVTSTFRYGQPMSMTSDRAPYPATKPVLTGSPIVGQTLTVAPPTWVGGSTSGQGWRRCSANGGFCVVLPSGAPQYVVTQADVGFTLRAAFAANGSGGVGYAISAPTVVVPAPAGSGGGGGGGDGGGGGGGNLPDLQIVQTADRASAAVGDQVMFRMDASMKNPTQSSGASNLVLTDVLPANVDFVSVRTNRGSCAGGRTVVCNLSAINGLLVATVELVVRVTGTGEIANTATLRADETDPDLTNNTSTARVNAPTPVTPAPKPAPSPTPAPKPKPLGVTRAGSAKGETLRGTAFADVLDGRAGADTLLGLAGNDRLTGGAGKDILDGAAGNDTIAARDGQKDTVRCGAGKDLVTADRSDLVAKDCEIVRRS